MHRLRLRESLIVAGGCLMAFILYTGCEDGPSDEGINSYFNNNPYQSESRQSPQAAPTASLTISPVSASAVPGQLINFTAAGGSSPFSWSEGTAANGTVAQQGNERYAIYTHLGTTNDANNVVVTDGSGATAIANIN